MVENEEEEKEEEGEEDEEEEKHTVLEKEDVQKWKAQIFREVSIWTEM